MEPDFGMVMTSEQANSFLSLMILLDKTVFTKVFHQLGSRYIRGQLHYFPVVERRWKYT